MPRAWRNIIVSCGLVNVPVSLSPALDKNNVPGKMICAEHELPVKQHYFCETGNHYVDQDGLAVGFERGDHMVVPDQAAITALVPERKNRVKIESFCPIEQIDPMWYENTYLMWPRKENGEAFHLLAQVIADKGMAAVGTTVLTTRERVAVIRYAPATETLLLHLCAFYEQVRWKDMGAGSIEAVDVGEPEYRLAEQLVESMAAPFAPENHHDAHRAALLELIEATGQGKPLPDKKTPHTLEETPDLLTALKKSIPDKKKKRAPAKKKAA